MLIKQFLPPFTTGGIKQLIKELWTEENGWAVSFGGSMLTLISEGKSVTVYTNIDWSKLVFEFRDTIEAWPDDYPEATVEDGSLHEAMRCTLSKYKI